MRRLLFILGLLASAPLFSQETLYVCDRSGEYGAEDGSSVADCFDGGIDVVWNATDETAGAVDPGDTLCVVGTHTYTAVQDRITPSVNGAVGDLITIKGDCDGVDVGILDGDDTGSSLINLTGREYFVVDGLTIQNTDTTAGQYALNIYSTAGSSTQARNITVQNNTVQDCGYICVYAFGAQLTFDNNEFFNCYDDCVYVSGGEDLSFTDNFCYSVSTGTIGGDCLQTFINGVDDTGAQVVTGNICNHITDLKYCFLVGMGDTTAGTIDLSNNVAICPATTAESDGCSPIYLDCTSNAVAHVVTVNANQTSRGWRSITLDDCADGVASNNIVADAGSFGLYLDANSDSINVWYNTALNNGGPGIYMTAANNVVQNNLAIGNVDYGIQMNNGGISHSYNQYWQNDDTSNLSLGGTDSTVNPDFIGLFPASGIAGTVVATTTDYYGRTRTVETVGAVEDSSAVKPVYRPRYIEP